MGRFGLVSLGHGGFMGVGAYVTALLWNHLGVSPWLGIPVAMAAAAVLAVIVAYPCFRFRITGHYFVLVTLALSGIVLQVITATRDYTGGSLGYTPDRTRGSHLLALQFDDKMTWYLIALGVWAVGLLIWRWVDRSMDRYALEAISEDEDAAAAAGVNVTWEKLKITVITALMTALAGALYCQYQMFISPDTVSGISVSLQMVFAAIVGGLYVSLGPTVGAVITILLAEILRIGFGTKAVGWDNLVYGVLLVVFIIFLPKGILGSLIERLRTQPKRQGKPYAPTKASSVPLAAAGATQSALPLRTPALPTAFSAARGRLLRSRGPRRRARAVPPGETSGYRRPSRSLVRKTKSARSEPEGTATAPSGSVLRRGRSCAPYGRHPLPARRDDQHLLKVPGGIGVALQFRDPHRFPRLVLAGENANPAGASSIGH